MNKKVCVVGAGPSGLVAIKELIAKNINVKCFETNDNIGGAFRSVESGGRSYDSLKLTVSNYFMAYSDFMPKGEDRKYWTVGEYRKYIFSYVDFFKLQKNIYLSHTVTSAIIKKGKVIVSINNNGVKYQEIFDHIIICSGSNFIPKLPELAGESMFEGEIIHSSGYSNASKFIGKDVVCIGLGESGADIVNEISEQANSCRVIVRDYPNVIPRWIHGFTNDSYTAHCLYAIKKKGLDRYMKLKASYYLKFDKSLSSEDVIIQKWIKERESFIGKFFTKSDVFIKNIVNERIKLTKDSLKNLTKNGIVTEKGEEIKADVLMLNTGYKTTLDEYEFGKDFLDPRSLFKQMIHPDYGNIVSLIGWARPTQGGLPACSEMQARYISLLISGDKEILTKKEMKKIIDIDVKFYHDFFNESLYIKSLVCYNNFMTSMGDLIGCSPKLFYPKDFSFTKKMLFGSHISSFYRLPDEQAKNTIEFLPIAYSKRRSVIMVLFILRYNPSFILKLIS